MYLLLIPCTPLRYSLQTPSITLVPSLSLPSLSLMYPRTALPLYIPLVYRCLQPPCRSLGRIYDLYEVFQGRCRRKVETTKSSVRGGPSSTLYRITFLTLLDDFVADIEQYRFKLRWRFFHSRTHMCACVRSRARRSVGKIVTIVTHGPRFG